MDSSVKLKISDSLVESIFKSLNTNKVHVLKNLQIKDDKPLEIPNKILVWDKLLHPRLSAFIQELLERYAIGIDQYVQGCFIVMRLEGKKTNLLLVCYRESKRSETNIYMPAYRFYSIGIASGLQPLWPDDGQERRSSKQTDESNTLCKSKLHFDRMAEASNFSRVRVYTEELGNKRYHLDNQNFKNTLLLLSKLTPVSYKIISEVDDLFTDNNAEASTRLMDRQLYNLSHLINIPAVERIRQHKAQQKGKLGGLTGYFGACAFLRFLFGSDVSAFARKEINNNKFSLKNNYFLSIIFNSGILNEIFNIDYTSDFPVDAIVETVLVKYSASGRQTIKLGLSKNYEFVVIFEEANSFIVYVYTDHGSFTEKIVDLNEIYILNPNFRKILEEKKFIPKKSRDVVNLSKKLFSQEHSLDRGVVLGYMDDFLKHSTRVSTLVYPIERVIKKIIFLGMLIENIDSVNRENIFRSPLLRKYYEEFNFLIKAPIDRICFRYACKQLRHRICSIDGYRDLTKWSSDEGFSPLVEEFVFYNTINWLVKNETRKTIRFVNDEKAKQLVYRILNDDQKLFGKTLFLIKLEHSELASPEFVIVVYGMWKTSFLDENTDNVLLCYGKNRRAITPELGKYIISKGSYVKVVALEPEDTFLLYEFSNSVSLVNEHIEYVKQQNEELSISVKNSLLLEESVRSGVISELVDTTQLKESVGKFNKRIESLRIQEIRKQIEIPDPEDLIAPMAISAFDSMFVDKGKEEEDIFSIPDVAEFQSVFEVRHSSSQLKNTNSAALLGAVRFLEQAESREGKKARVTNYDPLEGISDYPSEAGSAEPNPNGNIKDNPYAILRKNIIGDAWVMVRTEVPIPFDMNIPIPKYTEQTPLSDYGHMENLNEIKVLIDGDTGHWNLVYVPNNTSKDESSILFYMGMQEREQFTDEEKDAFVVMNVTTQSAGIQFIEKFSVYRDIDMEEEPSVAERVLVEENAPMDVNFFSSSTSHDLKNEAYDLQHQLMMKYSDRSSSINETLVSASSTNNHIPLNTDFQQNEELHTFFQNVQSQTMDGIQNVRSVPGEQIGQYESMAVVPYSDDVSTTAIPVFVRIERSEVGDIGFSKKETASLGLDMFYPYRLSLFNKNVAMASDTVDKSRLGSSVCAFGPLLLNTEYVGSALRKVLLMKEKVVLSQRGRIQPEFLREEDRVDKLVFEVLSEKKLDVDLSKIQIKGKQKREDRYNPIKIQTEGLSLFDTISVSNIGKDYNPRSVHIHSMDLLLILWWITQFVYVSPSLDAMDCISTLLNNNFGKGNKFIYELQMRNTAQTKNPSIYTHGNIVEYNTSISCPVYETNTKFERRGVVYLPKSTIGHTTLNRYDMYNYSLGAMEVDNKVAMYIRSDPVLTNFKALQDQNAASIDSLDRPKKYSIDRYRASTINIRIVKKEIDYIVNWSPIHAEYMSNYMKSRYGKKKKEPKHDYNVANLSFLVSQLLFSGKLQEISLKAMPHPYEFFAPVSCYVSERGIMLQIREIFMEKLLKEYNKNSYNQISKTLYESITQKVLDPKLMYPVCGIYNHWLFAQSSMKAAGKKLVSLGRKPLFTAFNNQKHVLNPDLISLSTFIEGEDITWILKSSKTQNGSVFLESALTGVFSRWETVEVLEDDSLGEEAIGTLFPVNKYVWAYCSNVRVIYIRREGQDNLELLHYVWYIIDSRYCGNALRYVRYTRDLNKVNCRFAAKQSIYNKNLEVDLFAKKKNNNSVSVNVSEPQPEYSVVKNETLVPELYGELYDNIMFWELQTIREVEEGEEFLIYYSPEMVRQLNKWKAVYSPKAIPPKRKSVSSLYFAFGVPRLSL